MQENIIIKTNFGEIVVKSSDKVADGMIEDNKSKTSRPHSGLIDIQYQILYEAFSQLLIQQSASNVKPPKIGGDFKLSQKDFKEFVKYMNATNRPIVNRLRIVWKKVKIQFEVILLKMSMKYHKWEYGFYFLKERLLTFWQKFTKQIKQLFNKGN